MQYHTSHAMTGLEEGGDGGVGWTWLDNVLDGCGIEVSGGGVDTALPQVRFNIERARDCMIERKEETRWCTGDKNTQQSAIQEGATAMTAAIPTKEGRRRRGAGRATTRWRKTTIGELAIFASMPPMQGQRKQLKGS